MLCNAFDQRVDRLLDERESLESDEEIRTHVAICPRCHAALRAHVQLLDILHKVEFPEQLTPQTRRMHVVGLIAAAATLLIAFTFFSSSALNTQMVLPVIAVQAEPQAVPLPNSEVPEAEFAPPRADGYLVHQTLVGLRLLSMGNWSTTINSVSKPFGAKIPQVDTEWVDVVADGMSPVQESVTSTLNLLRRTFAAGRPKSIVVES